MKTFDIVLSLRTKKDITEDELSRIMTRAARDEMGLAEKLSVAAFLVDVVEVVSIKGRA
jgi:hypothetical protein